MQLLEDHPRVCGEHEDFESRFGAYVGSSPRVRGALRRHGDGRLRRGIIPACAGSTAPAWTTAGSLRDHPRVCGEHQATSRRQRSW